MSLIPWRTKQNVPVRHQYVNSPSPLERLRSEMDRLFDGFFAGTMDLLPEGAFGNSASWLPSLDVSEDEKGVCVELDMPAVDPSDIDISVSGNILSIQGERRSEREDKGRDYHHVERTFGRFRRSVELSPNVDADSIKAEFKNGVLRITATKSGEEERRRIPIN